MGAAAQQAELRAIARAPLSPPVATERPEAAIPSVGPNIGGPPGATVETLEQAWAGALSVDRGLRAQQRSQSAADEAVQLAHAQRWPTAGIEGSVYPAQRRAVLQSEFRGHSTSATATFPYEQTEDFAARAKIDLPLYTSGRIEQEIAAAEAERAASALETEDAVMDLKMRVAGVYVAVLRAQRDVDLAETTVRSLESHTRDVYLRFRNDQIQQTDLLAAQVSLANARHAVIQAKNRLDGSRAAYNRYLGRPLTAAVRLAELPLETPTNDLDALTALALHTRPTLARLTCNVDALQHRAESVRAKSLPQVTLRGEYSYLQDRYQVPEGIASGGVGVSWNLFDGGRNRFEARNLSEQAEAIRCRHEELESVIALDVRRAWLDVQETRRRLETTPEAIRQAEENLPRRPPALPHGHGHEYRSPRGRDAPHSGLAKPR